MNEYEIALEALSNEVGAKAKENAILIAKLTTAQKAEKELRAEVLDLNEKLSKAVDGSSDAGQDVAKSERQGASADT